MGQISAKEIKEIEFYDIENGQVSKASSVGFHAFKTLDVGQSHVEDLTSNGTPILPNLGNQTNTFAHLESAENSGLNTHPLTSIKVYGDNEIEVRRYNSNNVSIGLLGGSAEGLEPYQSNSVVRGLIINMEF
jgi:hypothetical protein